MRLGLFRPFFDLFYTTFLSSKLSAEIGGLRKRGLFMGLARWNSMGEGKDFAGTVVSGAKKCKQKLQCRADLLANFLCTENVQIF